MAKLEEQINQMEQIDQLIRFGKTGNPAKLAKRLAISEASLFRLLEIMKNLGAPIKFDIFLQSYVYEYDVKFQFGFYGREISPAKAKGINGGYSNLKFLINF
jgi:hypothetical protein